VGWDHAAEDPCLKTRHELKGQAMSLCPNSRCVSAGAGAAVSHLFKLREVLV